MEKLRTQIKESFFNPVLHFLPLLIFLVVDEFFGMDLAWKISFPVALILLVYIYLAYNRIFMWHLLFTLFFVLVCFVSCSQLFLSVPESLEHLGYKISIVALLIPYFLFRRKIEKRVPKVVSRLIPMTNNFRELYKVVLKLFLILAFYIIGSLVLYSANLSNSAYQELLISIYMGLLVFLSIYEVLRVMLIRSNLLREEWWPIVNEKGKIIGSVQHVMSLNDENKYMHPVVRVLIIDKGMILLQKRPVDSAIYSGLWDSAISNHVKMGETVEQCVERTAEERYSLTNFKYMYLSNYNLELEKELHYAFLFISCQQSDYVINPRFTDQMKWWTQQQIEEEFDNGIFSDNFKIEYDLVKRSGLLESGKCECSCRLKDVIYQLSDDAKRVV